MASKIGYFYSPSRFSTQRIEEKPSIDRMNSKRKSGHIRKFKAERKKINDGRKCGREEKKNE